MCSFGEYLFWILDMFNLLLAVGLLIGIAAVVFMLKQTIQEENAAAALRKEARAYRDQWKRLSGAENAN
jgi:hypothetical protein